jgi:hypothetical protein
VAFIETTEEGIFIVSLLTFLALSMEMPYIVKIPFDWKRVFMLICSFDDIFVVAKCN